MQSKPKEVFPQRLTAPNFMHANLDILKQNGFSLEQHFFKNPDEDSSYPFWIAEKGGVKVVFFYPSKDTAKNFDLEGSMPGMSYILYTQHIAKHYIEQGYTCILPVVEYLPFDSIVSESTVNTIYSLFNPKGEKIEYSRMHWVTLIWNNETLGFFDPKSSQNYVAKYDNTVFKKFAENAGYVIESKSLLGLIQNKDANKGWYGLVKWEHPQKLNDPNNCGYYTSKNH
jgi:hypothetical protein